MAHIDKLRVAMQRWFLAKGYATHLAHDGARTVLDLLIKTLKSPDGQWVLQPHEAAHNELAIECGGFSGDVFQVQKRIIDRTFIEQGVRWIIDYKSTALLIDIDEAGLRQAAEQYRQQLEQYRILFSDEILPIKLAIYFLSVGKLIEI